MRKKRDDALTKLRECLAMVTAMQAQVRDMEREMDSRLQPDRWRKHTAA